ncbi:hypothetical protein JTE90_009495 [Oedothorax gibbosus]|uniref:Uncharacterized protein n=1 Tax=Oedothorax gibbosus TaxID=931172 RepID=A0AAV6UUE8_9ARAC|nr:hypothetical protein JTE90_009495 [Oedothorax gibbosus]
MKTHHTRSKYSKMFVFTLSFYLWIFPHLIKSQNVQQGDSSSISVQTLDLGPLQLTLSSKLLLDVHSPGYHTLKGYLGWLPKNSNMSYSSCSPGESPEESVCLHYGKDMKLLVTQDNADRCEEDSMTCHAVPCHKIRWVNHVGGAMDCFLLGEDDWYGGGERLYQRWPLEDESRPWYPSVTGDPLHHPSGNVIEHMWLSSGGFVIHVEDTVPLFVSFNESGSGKLCFTTSTKKHPYETAANQELVYSICSASSLKEAFMFGRHKWIEKPTDIPEEAMFQHPIWSTWARYKRGIDEEIVLKFAKEIKFHEFPASQIQIDDMWENCYGNLEFNFTKFPDPKRMTDSLQKMGLPATLWVHPFCNKECDTFSIGENKGYWVKNREGKTVEVKWWNGERAAMLDTTNKNAMQWFKQRLQMLKSKYSITSFKFDAGELLWLEKSFVLHDPTANLQKNLFSKSWAELAATFGGRVEVRVGYNSQRLPTFIRMFDKFSSWDQMNGLQSLIPCALHLSLMGYYFILPDMIGGNNYESYGGSLPDKELYIRWLEATVFMPSIQFSIVPWDYDDEVISISRKMVALHEKYSNFIIKTAEKATETGEPIIRPLWYSSSDDDYLTLRTDSQFLVGGGIMVAPILEKGKIKRDIYLPEGKWYDVQKKKTHEGPQWLYDYEAPLSFLPFFTKQS